jgi:hypothetical protein
MHTHIHIQEGSVAAEHGGIGPGDTLVSIDQEDLSGKPLQAVARAMMAPPGAASQVNMCVCVCVCVFVGLYVYISTCIRLYMHVHICIYMNTYKYT